MRNSRTAGCAAGTLLLLLAAGSHGEAPNAQAALARAQGMLRQLNDAKQQLELDNAKLRASNAALEQQVKIGRLNLAARETDIVTRGKEAGEARAGIARLESRNAQLTARLEEVVAKYKEAAGNARQLSADKATLEGDLKAARAALADAEEKNRAMFAASREILERYRKKSPWTALLQNEPFTGIKQVEVESGVEGEEHALEEQLLERNLDAAQ